MMTDIRKLEFFNEKEGEWLKEMELSQPVYWNISQETAEFLVKLILENKFKQGLEIGTSTGYSGIWLAKALVKNGGKLITVESHAERFKMAEANFKKFGVDSKIVMVKGHAPEVLEGVPNSRGVLAFARMTFDFVFLDATKMEYSSYFSAIWPRLEVGGMIVADNVFSHREQMKDFLLIADQQKGLKKELIQIGTGLLVLLKESMV